MDKQHAQMVSDNFYHVFNRAIGSEKLFISIENYRYFLQKLKFYVVPVADVFAYSLLPNHFHLTIRIKPAEILTAYFKSKKGRTFDAQKHTMSQFIMQCFSNWLNAYTKAFNIMYERKGGLFMDYTKRVELKTESDITNVILYTHQNAVHHGLRKEIGQWPFDSYTTILGFGPTSLMRTEVIEWFGSIELFEEFHKQPIEPRTHKILSKLNE